MFDVIIPARFASTRLPGKVLEKIGATSMVERVIHQALSSDASRVIVAVDDPRVFQAVQGLGATVVMTSSEHKTGSDRIAEVIDILGIPAQTIVVNVQADEPFIAPELITSLARHLDASNCLMGSLYTPIHLMEDYLNPHQVKVILDDRGCARYFSRSPIPYQKQHENGRIQAKGHIGLYAYRAHFVKTFCQWPVSTLEALESLEQLRAVERGVEIAMLKTDYHPLSIDTPEDLERARRYCISREPVE